MADSGESDVPAAQNVQNNVPDAQGVRHVKVADAAHSAAQAALEAAQAAQQAAQVAQQVAQTGQVPKIESQPQSSQPVAPLPSFEPKPVTAESRSSPTRPQGGALMTWMICLFGGIGAMARYVLDVSIQRSWNRDGNHSFPLATLVINGVASLCAGIAMMSYYAQSVDMGTVMTSLWGSSADSQHSHRRSTRCCR